MKTKEGVGIYNWKPFLPHPIEMASNNSSLSFYTQFKCIVEEMGWKHECRFKEYKLQVSHNMV
jgi:hypothetical protein